MIDGDYLLEAFKASRNPCFIVLPDSPAYSIMAVSRIVLNRLSVTEEEILNQSASAIFPVSASSIHTKQGLNLFESFQAVIKTSMAQDVLPLIPMSMKASNGQEEISWKGESIPLFDQNGALQYILFSAIEIINNKGDAPESVRPKAYDDVFDERHTILESIGEAFYRVDNNWIVTYWNNQAEKMLGQPRENILNKNLWEIYHDAIDTPFYHNFQKATRENQIVRFEALYETLQLWLEVNVFPSRSGCSVYFKDITEKKKTEERIRDSEERSRLIMNAALDAIICMDKRGLVTFWNPQAAATFGWDQKEVMGKKLSEFIIPERFRHRHDAGLELYLQNGEEQVLNRILELEGLRRDGQIFPIELTVIPINQPSEAFFCAFIRDISARKIAEENIRQQAIDLEISNKELEQFAYVASHDLQEPLRMVTGFLKQLENRYADIIDDRGKQYIHFAVDGAKRMRQIILDLLRFSRVGRWEEAAETVDTQILAKESLNLFSSQIDETAAKITIHPLPVISTYKTLLGQVFQNLLGNALKYRKTGTSPIIDMSARENGSDWEFTFTDNGIGIAKEYHERVFIIFQRLHNREEYSGTGIGLAIVKKIITNLGGKIWIDSEPGEGTAFHFTVPKQHS
ncbi:sensor histidine kinase [Flavitalea antarctica]